MIDFDEARKRLQVASGPPVISRLVPPWLASRRADGFRPRGVLKYQQCVGQFQQYAGDVVPPDITSALLRRYKLFLMERVSPGTTRNILTAVREFCGWLQLEGWIDHNPALSVPHPRVPIPDPDPLSGEQVTQLLAVLNMPSKTHKATQQRNRRAVGLMIYAGLRISEVADLERRDLDLDRREIRLRAEAVKGGQKGRLVPVAGELLMLLEPVRGYNPGWAVIDKGEDRPGERLHVKSLAHLFERWLPDRLGWDLHAHQLRKTFATELYIQGADLLTIQRLLGHADPKTTARYIGVSGSKEREAVELLSFKQGRNND